MKTWDTNEKVTTYTIQHASKFQLYLSSLFVAGRLLRLKVEKVHLATEGGQEFKDQTMFGHLQFQQIND